MCNRFLAWYMVLSQHIAMSCVQNDANDTCLQVQPPCATLSHSCSGVHRRQTSGFLGRPSALCRKQTTSQSQVRDLTGSVLTILCCRQSLPCASPHMNIMACYSEVCLEIGFASGMQDEHLATAMPAQHVSMQLSAISMLQGCQSRGRLQVVAAEKQGAPTTTKKRTTGPPILPPINDNVSHLCTSVPGASSLLIPPLEWDASQLPQQSQFPCTAS